MKAVRESQLKSFLVGLFFMVIITMMVFGLWLYGALSSSYDRQFRTEFQLNAAKIDSVLKESLTKLTLRAEEIRKDNTCRAALLLGIPSEVEGILNEKNKNPWGLYFAVQDREKHWYFGDMSLNHKNLFTFAEQISEIRALEGTDIQTFQYEGQMILGLVRIIERRKEILGYLYALYIPSEDLHLRKILLTMPSTHLAYVTASGLIDIYDRRLLARFSQSEPGSGHASGCPPLMGNLFCMPLEGSNELYVVADLRGPGEMKKDLMITILYVGLSVLTITLLISWVYWKRFATSCRNFIYEIESVAKQPLEKSIDLGKFRFREHILIAEAFNALLKELHAAHGRLRQGLKDRLDLAEKRLEALINRSSLGILLIDGHGIITWANEFSATLLRLQKEELVGKQLSELNLGLSAGELYEKACKDKVEIEVNGRSVELQICEIEENDQKAAMLIINDITRRKEAESKRKLLEYALDHAADAVAIMDEKGGIIYANYALTTVTGIQREKVIGAHITKLRDLVSDKVSLSEIDRRVREEGQWTGRLRVKQIGGHGERHLDVMVNYLEPPGEGTHYYVMVCRDVTTGVLSEQRQREQQKFQALGTLAAGIAHDFNNIMAIISGHMELMFPYLRNSDRSAELIERYETIMKAIGRAKNIVQQILTFARQREGEEKILELNPLVKEFVRFFRAVTPAEIDIQAEVPQESLCTRIDPAQFHQMLLNLATNAVQAMTGGGSLHIKMDRVTIDPARAVRLGISPGEYVFIEVRDTGIGIPKEHIDRIFEPFFTTKKPGEGTGLGLSVVQGIVHKAGGAITVESEVGKGACFTVYLPLLKLPVETQEGAFIIPREARETEKKGLSVLIVDDEPFLASWLGEFLRSKGYNVIEYADPLDVLNFIQHNRSSVPDIIISDYSMKHLNGIELIRRITEMGHRIPSILMSGYSISASRYGDLPICKILYKPFSSEELLDALKSAQELFCNTGK